MADEIALGEFSVAQFFADGTHEYVRRGISAEEAIKVFEHYCHSVGARLGTTTGVIITDGEDFTNMHWTYKDGIVFPAKLRGRWRPTKPAAA